ncbi:dipeptidyl-peptidase, putative [Pediculus humanus corporis]|uniref:Venom dipeptidyl peptidase 4 n=1 Tax=Pediculus humanus subsp. corporis TaxID=121224 RepID=E0VHA4_PEDHC|nr:dipeptidyl-peptidase, putative [Pediculus humanus corporis]EEB12760.1 dipeptidyl-peptidase, putative [Pediculus humanus corporis]
MSDSNLQKENSLDERQKRVALSTSQRKEDLNGSPPSERNWRGILIALLVIIAVLGLIICSIFLLSPPDEEPRVRGKLISFDNIVQNKYKPRFFNGSWISELEMVYRDEYGNVKMLCVENFTTKSLITNTTFELVNAVDYKVSADLNYILLITNAIRIWKYSFRAKYYVYEIATEEYFPLKASQEYSDSDDFPFLESATWAPTGNAIVFVQENNLYYKARIRKPQVYTITRDGMKNIIFNGRPDFFYETKVLQSGTAFWFSSDSTMLAFASFNVTDVEKLHYSQYGTTKYGEIKTINYPRTGTENPKVKLTVVNMTYPKILKTTIVQPPSIYVKNNDYYLTGVKWIDSKRISVTWMNRKQNITSISICKAPQWMCTDIYQDFGKESWVNKIEDPIFDNNGTWFLAILPLQGSNGGRFQELCQVDSASRKFIYLTTPPMIVKKILAWDMRNHVVYFIAVLEPGSRHLFKTGDRHSSHRSWDCLTCFYGNRTSFYNKKIYNNISVINGFYKNFLVNVTLSEDDSNFQCLYSNVYFNSVYNPKYYVLDCLGPEVPSVFIFDVSTNSMLAVLDANSELRSIFQAMAVPQIRKFQVELESGYHAQVKLLLPPGLREYEDISFPLILNVDSSPGSQLITEEFKIDWWWYLSSCKNIIIAEIDGRSSDFQGDKIIHRINNKIGAVEVEDQIAVVTYLRDTLKFIDKNRMGVFGKGQGGYLAGMIIGQDKDLFRCGVLVNPITNFLLADTYTSEKYMGHPNDSEKYKNYEESDLNKKIESFKGKQFLLISSLADTEVPVEHSMVFVQNLIKENIIFRHQVYPDEDHDLTGVSLHYYNLIETFWNDVSLRRQTIRVGRNGEL